MSWGQTNELGLNYELFFCQEMYESAQKTRSGRTSGGDEISEYKAKVSDLQYQVHVLEDELAEMKLRASKSNADAIALKSNYEIQVEWLLRSLT